MSNQVINKI
ncbi:hypothetical protein VCHC37A1_2440A, partial [Vibrio cholerae HC-37A1]